MADEIQGLSVKVNITDELFTQGISKINSSMKLLQSEFKASSEGLKGFGNDAQQLGSKQEYLNKAIQLQEQKVKQLKEAYEKSKSECGEFANSTMNAGTKVNGAVAQLSKMQNELKQVDEELQKSGKEADEQGNVFTKLGDKVKSAFSGMGEYIKQGIGLAIGGDIWDKAKEGIGSVVTFSNDLQVSLNSLQSATGATGTEMGSLKQVMLDIYNDNFGSGFDDISESLANIKQQTGLSGDALKELTEKALLVRDAFDMEVNESVRSANMMMKQFGLSGDEAYNLIAQGAQNGLNKNDDLLDSVNEYSVHFKQLGLDATDMFNMLKNGSASGTFSVDKLGDSVKEFGIRVKDGSQTTDDAFALLGINTSDIEDKFLKGGESAKQAFAETTQALLEMKDPFEQNIAGVNLFGTMWEDLGVKGISALTNMNGSISTTKDALTQINNVKYNDIGSAFEGIKRNIETGVLVPIGDKLLPKLNEFGQWFQSNMPNIKEQFSNAFDRLSPIFDALGQGLTLIISNINTIIPLVATFGATFAALKIAGIIQMAITAFTSFKLAIMAGSGVMTAFNAVCSVNPISLIVIAIGALVAGIVLLYNKCEWFRNGVNGIWAWMKNLFTVTIPQAFNTVINFFQNNWKELLLLIVNPISGGFALLYKNCDGFREFINNFVETVKNLFINGWNEIVNFFTTTVPSWLENMKNWFLELPNKLAEGLGQAVGTVMSWGINVWNYLSTNVPIWISNVGTFFMNLPSVLWNAFVQANVKLAEWGVQVINYITTNVPNWINNISNFFSQLPAKIWTFLLQVVTNITTWGSNMLNEAKTGMTNVYNGIVDTFKNLPSKMLDIGKNIVDGLKNGISNAWSNLKSWMGGLCNDFIKGVKEKFDIHSPSRVFRDQVGAMLAQGIGVGFEGEMPSINQNISKTLDGTIKIANLSSLNSLKSSDKISNNNGGNNNQPIIVYMTSITQLDGKEISKTTTKEVLNNLNRNSKNNNVANGRSKLKYV